MIITLGGLPGSGTSTVAKKLADILQLEIVSAGNMFRDMAKEMGISLVELGKMAKLDPSNQPQRNIGTALKASMAFCPVILTP